MTPDELKQLRILSTKYLNHLMQSPIATVVQINQTETSPGVHALIKYHMARVDMSKSRYQLIVDELRTGLKPSNISALNDLAMNALQSDLTFTAMSYLQTAIDMLPKPKDVDDNRGNPERIKQYRFKPKGA